MFVMLVVRAFALVTLDTPPVAPWVEDLGTVTYRAAEHASVKGRTPWTRESLNPSGTLPAVAVKGVL